ncbi:hypothetical protein B0H14DRAFT_2649313 [Mycena olivaceomarginata]|nr:hypothetical protein B0H14DRAFT_2649313 [Mycena olivaceomarginata]
MSEPFRRRGIGEQDGLLAGIDMVVGFVPTAFRPVSVVRGILFLVLWSARTVVSTPFRQSSGSSSRFATNEVEACPNESPLHKSSELPVRLVPTHPRNLSLRPSPPHVNQLNQSLRTAPSLWDMPPHQSRPEALPFLLYAGLPLKSKTSIWEPFHGQDNTVYRTPVLETLEKAKFPPVWKPACPEETNEDLKKLNFKDLSKLVEEAKHRKWGPDMDDLVAKQLDQLSRGVREVYNIAVCGAEVSAQWWPSVDTYSVGPSEPLKLWWGNILSRIIEKDKKARDRARPKLEKLVREVEKLLGANFLKGSDEAATKFSTSMFLTALRKLTTASELLGWEALLPTDYATSNNAWFLLGVQLGQSASRAV